MSVAQSIAALAPQVAPPTAGVSVGSYRGSNQELTCFVRDTWAEAYSERMSFPMWTPEYFNWQVTPGPDQPDRRLAAYVDGELAAVLLGTPHTFRTPSGVIDGANYSWLSVAKKFRGQGLSTLLDQARVKFERELQSELVVSYRFNGSKHSLAERPSQKCPLKKFHRRMGFWARPLDGKRVQKWNLNKAEGLISRTLSPVLLPLKWSASADIRLFEENDLHDCLAVTEAESKRSQLAVQWDKFSLQHQLAGSPITRTVVARVAGKTRGFVNFHLLPFQGVTEQLVAVVDLICVARLSVSQQVDLLRSALWLMRDQGAILALKLRERDVASALMLACGFVPRPTDSTLVLQWMTEAQDIPRSGRMNLLWR